MHTVWANRLSQIDSYTFCISWGGIQLLPSSAAIVIVAPLRQSWLDKLQPLPSFHLHHKCRQLVLTFGGNLQLDAAVESDIKDILPSLSFERVPTAALISSIWFGRRHKKDLLSSPTRGVCKHSEGELDLKAGRLLWWHIWSIPTRRLFREGLCRVGGIFEVFLKRRFRGDVLPDLVLPHWNPAGPGGGWKFYFTKKLNHLSPIRYPRAEWQQWKRELWTFNVFRRIAP